MYTYIEDMIWRMYIQPGFDYPGGGGGGRWRITQKYIKKKTIQKKKQKMF
jgi:hypothetical protein